MKQKMSALVMQVLQYDLIVLQMIQHQQYESALLLLQEALHIYHYIDQHLPLIEDPIFAQELKAAITHKIYTLENTIKKLNQRLKSLH